MVISIQKAIYLAIACSQFASAQTHSDCSVVKGHTNCPSNAGLLDKTYSHNFANGNPKGFQQQSAGKIDFTPEGAKFIVAKSGDSRGLVSDFYMLFGSVEVKLKAAGKGIISTLVLQSDVQDEIDWELNGKNNQQAETAYFGKGDDKEFTNGAAFPAADNQNTFHTYKMDWTPEAITWSIDGTPVRTLKYSDAKGGTRFPQTPSRIKLDAWAAGDTKNRPGTVEWAGGPIDWNAAPFIMTVESINIVNYTPAKEFSYGDNSGDFKSIKIVKGTLMSNGAAAPQAPPPPPPSSAGPAPAPVSSAHPAHELAQPSATKPTVVAPSQSAAGGEHSGHDMNTSSSSAAPSSSAVSSKSSSVIPTPVNTPVAQTNKSNGHRTAVSGMAGLLVAAGFFAMA